VQGSNREGTHGGGQRWWRDPSFQSPNKDADTGSSQAAVGTSGSCDDGLSPRAVAIRFRAVPAEQPLKPTDPLGSRSRRRPERAASLDSATAAYSSDCT
jgi:hypothetical protein